MASFTANGMPESMLKLARKCNNRPTGGLQVRLLKDSSRIQVARNDRVLPKKTARRGGL
jgi:hypothetical protein